MNQTFKRVHFFNGMLATEDDWNAGHEYHRELRKFHNKWMHGAGVIRHFRESLLVRATKPAGLRVMVQPGVAIDNEGREILLSDPQMLAFNPDEFAEGGKPFEGFLFVVLRYDERPDAFAVSATDARIQGHKRVEEKAVITLEKEEPRDDGIELARIRWGAADVNRITDAIDFSNPGMGQIDLRYVPFVGAPGGKLDIVASQHLMNDLDRRNKLLGELANRWQALEANLPRPGLLQARVALRQADIDRPALADLLRNILDLEEEMTTLIEQRPGSWERIPPSHEYKGYVKAIRETIQRLKRLENGPQPNMEAATYREEFARALVQFRGINNTLESMLKRMPEMLEEKAGPEPFPEISAEALAVWGKSEMPRRIAINGVSYVLIDQLDITNVASEEAHRFRIDAGPKDVVEGQTAGTYPGMVNCTDSGISYRRGSIQFVVGDLVPGKDVLLIRRIELRDLKVEEEVRVDDQIAGTWRFEGNDDQHIWRNVMMGVNGEFVSGARPRIRLQLSGESSPSNLYRIWVYQVY